MRRYLLLTDGIIVAVIIGADVDASELLARQYLACGDEHGGDPFSFGQQVVRVRADDHVDLALECLCEIRDATMTASRQGGPSSPRCERTTMSSAPCSRSSRASSRTSGTTGTGCTPKSKSPNEVQQSRR